MVVKYLGLLFTTLYFILLTACSSVPILVPDMAMQSSKKISLENAYGVISNQQSKKILEKIKKDGLETNIFDKHLDLFQRLLAAR